MIAWGLVDPPSATPFVAACAIAYLLATLGPDAVLRRRVRQAIGRGCAAFEVRGWMRVAMPMLMHGAAFILLTNTDLVMRGLLLEPAQVGIYTAARRIATLVSFVHVVLTGPIPAPMAWALIRISRTGSPAVKSVPNRPRASSPRTDRAMPMLADARKIQRVATVTKRCSSTCRGRTCRCAQITCIINGLSNVELGNAALGARTASASMLTVDHRGRGRGGATRVLTDDAPRAEAPTEEVAIVAVDDVIPEERRLSLLQLDVEHYEKACLSGALKNIARCLPILVLERLPAPDWLERHILGLGHALTERVHHNHVLRPPPAD